VSRFVFLLVVVALASAVVAERPAALEQQPPLDGLTMRSCCRVVDIVLVDPQGRRTGVDLRSGTSLTEIPRSSYLPNAGIDGDVTGQPDPDPGKEIEVMGPQPGSYGLQLAARADTRYRLELRAFDQRTSRDALRSLTDVPILKGEIHCYRLRYTRGPELALTREDRPARGECGP
jgi:hypothetical protein